MVYVHGKSGEAPGVAVTPLKGWGAVSLKGWRECSGIIEGGGASSENILRREFDVLEGDYK